MGIAPDTIRLLFIARKHVSDSWTGIKVCEFGNQHIRKDTVPYKTGKEYLTSIGANHVSIDMNGKDGALPLDLDGAISDIGEPFDIVTNFGTIEHVDGQYMPFRNMHNLARAGGAMIHVLPLIEHWRKHGDHHYEERFISKLSIINEYTVVYFNVIERAHKQNLICSVLGKTKDAPFISEDDFNAIGGIYR